MSLEPFADFYRGHYRLVLTIAHQRLGSFLDAEDVTAEVFQIAWQEQQEGRDLSLPWLYQVLRNCVGDEYRRRERRDALLERIGSVADHDHWQDAAAGDVELRRLISDLPVGDRELIRMAYWEDLTRAEIAQILGCTEAAVRVRLLRARRRLRSALDGGQGSERLEVTDGRA